MRSPFSIVLIMLALCGRAEADNIHAVRPLTGYVCMQLNLSSDQGGASKEVPIRETPSVSARVVSYAASTVIVQASQTPVGGFLRVLRFTGEQGWVQASRLRPWSNPYAPSTRCIPSIMSDGKPGFGSAG